MNIEDMEGLDLDALGQMDNYEKKVYDQQQLIEISKALNSTLDLSTLIDSILNISLAQSQTFQIAIYLNPEIDTNDFSIHGNVIGFDIESPEKMIIPAKSPILQFFSANKKAYCYAQLMELKSQNRLKVEKELMDQFESISNDLTFIPMVNKNKVNGLVIIGPKTSGQEYISSELDFLLDLASIASIAVDNARLYQLATVDMMTKLKIHHFFQTRLREEMEKSRETGAPLSMFMTDIDHFKKFNDTYGHQQGDVVLKEVAQVLIRSARGNDVPSRYGGEEFAMILPNTSLQAAKEIAERVRKNVEKSKVKNYSGVGEDKLSVSISAGVAQFNPVLDETNKHLIEKCDKALYKAKHNGRNRVEISQDNEAK